MLLSFTSTLYLNLFAIWMDQVVGISSNPQTNFTPSPLVPQTDKPSARTEIINDYLKGRSLIDSFELFGFVILISLYVLFIALIHSQLLGWIYTQLLNPILRFVWETNVYFKVSSFSLLSIHTGRIVIRDLRFVTPDFRVRVCEGVFVVKWWLACGRCLFTAVRRFWYRRIFRKTPPPVKLSRDLIHLHLYGLDIHFINRTQVYSRLFHVFNLEDSRWKVKEQDTASLYVKINSVLIFFFSFVQLV